MVTGNGYADRYLDAAEIKGIIEQGLGGLQLEGKRVLFIIPDGTRTMPMDLMFPLFQQALAGRVAVLDFLVALGTHQPMTDEQLTKMIGHPVVEGMCEGSHIFNHLWEDPDTFVELGTIPAAEISALSEGMLERDVTVALNKKVLEYDQVIICGPIFPHEVVGFSGGNKYFVPGIAGPEVINFTHWLGALITNFKVIGSGYTPVRAVIDRAASLVPTPTACFALVVTHAGLAGLYFGTPQQAWEAGSKLSAQKHIVYVDKPYKLVISVMPEMYDDLWTGAKGMYKMEPAIADGGEVIIYAPHISEVSYTHGKVIDEVGYHCRDYFLAQPERFVDYPGGVLAHSTHVAGQGSYDAATCTENPRIKVTLATAIPPERCAKINLGYLDPATLNITEYLNREDEGILVVMRAGEMLYKVR